MKFYQRLDVQLTLIFVGILSLTVTLTSWIHERGVIINLAGPFYHFETALKNLEPQVRAFEAASDAQSLESLVSTVKQQYPETLILVINDQFQIQAQTTQKDSHVELVRREPDPEYFVVNTSSVARKLDYILYFHMVPGLAFRKGDQTLHLLMVPEPWIIDPPDMRPILFDGLRHHFHIYGWFYGAVILFFVFFIRWRLKPLRQIEIASNRLTQKEIPPPIPGKPKQDEVGHLVFAFNEALRRLSENEETRKRMVADIAHELRTPLTNLTGRIEAYEDKLIDDPDAIIQFAASQIESLTRIVNDLALLSSSDAGELVMQLELFPLKQTLETWLTSANLGNRFTWELQGKEHEVMLDPHRMRQIFQNLIDNAIKAKPTDLELSLRLVRAGERVTVIFEDNGPGVPTQALDRLFERLYRPDASRSAKTGGSGLGLSIVESLIQAQGGSIRAYAIPTGGLGFEMILPVDAKKMTS